MCIRVQYEIDSYTDIRSDYSRLLCYNKPPASMSCDCHSHEPVITLNLSQVVFLPVYMTDLYANIFFVEASGGGGKVIRLAPTF